MDELTKYLGKENLRQIFANLIREKISVKDIYFIFEKLAYHSQNMKNPNILSEKYVRIYVFKLAKGWHLKKHKLLHKFVRKLGKKLEKAYHNNEDYMLLDLSTYELNALISDIRTNFYTEHNQVIICLPKIRLALQR